MRLGDENPISPCGREHREWCIVGWNKMPAEGSWRKRLRLGQWQSSACSRGAGRGRRSSRQGAPLTSLHAYCGNLFKKQLDAASPNCHTSPAGSEPREWAGKERLEDQVRGMGADVHASVFGCISRSPRLSAEIHLSCDFLFHIYGGSEGEGRRGGLPPTHTPSPGVVI